MDGEWDPSLHSQLTKSLVVLNADFLESVSWKILQYISLEMSIKSTEVQEYVCRDEVSVFESLLPVF